MSLPAINAAVFQTDEGTPYLRLPGVITLAMPQVNLTGVQAFLDGFNPQLGYKDYLADPTELNGAEALCKFAGQLCYMSFKAERTWNKDISRYLEHIKSSGHGSVLEHANFSFLLYGISRSVTHELVRHRAGAAYSQLSQRYVSADAVRFVERPEFQADEALHEAFLRRIDASRREYAFLADKLLQKQLAGEPLMSADRKTDLRKKVNQAARACLPNETEAPIVVTLNVRAMRHILEMRVASGAEIEIRQLGYRLFQCIHLVAPQLFEDYQLRRLLDDTVELYTPYRKV